MKLPQDVINDIARETEKTTKDAVASAVDGIVQKVSNTLVPPVNNLKNVVDDFTKNVNGLKDLRPDHGVWKNIFDRFTNGLGQIQIPEPPNPHEMVNWVLGQGQGFVDGLMKLVLWIRVDNKLVTDPTKMYTAIVRAIEQRNRSIGDTTPIDVGGLAVAPLANFILAHNQMGSRDMIIDKLGSTLRNQLHLEKDVLVRNPADWVIATAIICITLVAISLSVPVVVTGGSVFVGVAIALVVAVTLGNEIDVSASNPVKFKVDAKNPSGDLELGPIVTFAVRKKIAA